MATVLPASLQNCLQSIIHRSNEEGGGIRAILLSTTEGVPLGRVYAAASTTTRATDSTNPSPFPSPPLLNEEVLATIECMWAPAATKQFPILGLEKLQQVTAIYDHGTLVYVNRAPVIITLLCTPQNNLGSIRSTAIPLLKEVLEPLSTTLVNSLKPDFGDDSLYYR